MREAKEENPNAFGKNNVSTLLVMGDMGNATVVEVGENILTQTALQSLLSNLLDFVSKRGKSRKLRAAVFIEDAHRIVPRIRSPVTEALVNTIAQLKDYGIGFIIEAEDEAHVHKILVDLVETTVRTVNDGEVGVRLLTKRPYRVKLRPFASGVSV